MKRFIYLFPAVAALLFGACKPTLDAPEPANAGLDLSKYVAVGDYNTAGFTNGGISRESQQTAYPAILSRQFELIGGPVNFVQPFFNSPTQMLALSFTPEGRPVISNTGELEKLLLAGCIGGSATTFDRWYQAGVNETGSLQNLGVPGLKVLQFQRAGLGNNTNAGNPANFNAYFERLLPENDNRKYLEVVGQSRPTFFTAWFGLSDISSFALSGATCGRMPTANQYVAELAVMLDTLTARRTPTAPAARKGVILNLPLLADYPFTALAEPIALQQQLRQQTNNPNLIIWVQVANAAGFPTAGTVADSIDSKDRILAGGLNRIGQLEDVVVNGQIVKIPYGLSAQNPLRNADVLDRKEVGYIDELVNDYNTKINNLLNSATSPYAGKVILADMKQLFGTLRNGVIYNGVKYDLSPIRGGVFSYDNFTLTPRGHAIVANKIIRSMNQEVLPSGLFTGFGTNIPEVNVNDYPATELP